MIRKIIYGIYAIIGMMVVAACSSRPDVYEISLEKMQGFPTEDAGFLKGVSALYAGVIDGNLLIAGGCNFPDTPAADGGKKGPALIPVPALLCAVVSGRYWLGIPPAS